MQKYKISLLYLVTVTSLTSELCVKLNLCMAVLEWVLWHLGVLIQLLHFYQFVIKAHQNTKYLQLLGKKIKKALSNISFSIVVPDCQICQYNMSIIFLFCFYFDDMMSIFCIFLYFLIFCRRKQWSGTDDTSAATHTRLCNPLQQQKRYLICFVMSTCIQSIPTS
jgi:hypothetical protein